MSASTRCWAMCTDRSSLASRSIGEATATTMSTAPAANAAWRQPATERPRSASFRQRRR